MLSLSTLPLLSDLILPCGFPFCLYEEDSPGDPCSLCDPKLQASESRFLGTSSNTVSYFRRPALDSCSCRMHTRPLPTRVMDTHSNSV